MYKFINNNLISLILSISISIIFSTYFIEYILGYEACNLCLIERIPYFFAIAFSFFFLLSGKYKRLILTLLFISFISNALIAFYHFGIEQNFFVESFMCKIKSLNQNVSANELLQELENNKKSCKNVNFKIFGLSLATINLFISLILSTIVFRNIYQK